MEIFKTPVKHVVVVYKDGSQDTLRQVRHVEDWFKKHHIKIHCLPQSNQRATKEKLSGAIKEAFADIQSVDLVIVLGGDGTYLYAVQHISNYAIPVLGINTGSLGFLTMHRQELIDHCLESVIHGKMVVEERTLIDIQIIEQDHCIGQYIALNDMVIERGSLSQLIGISVAIENQNIYFIKADGLIVSSPTGSTAYNLAAGGPILHPHVNAMSVTPICSHSLTNRPVIVPDSCKISFQINNKNQKAFLTIDGRQTADILKKHKIIVQKSHKVHKILRDKNYNYFLLLKDKFKFSQ